MFGEHWAPVPSVGFIIALVLALWATFHIVQSSASPFAKAVWTVVVLFLPLLGFLAWLFVGPRKK